MITTMNEPFSLSDEEIELLLTPIQFDDLSRETVEQDMPLDHPPLLQLLSQAQNTAIDAHFDDYYLRFPLHINDQNTPSVGIPEIYDMTQNRQRLWRLANPSGIQLLDQDNQPMIVTILNLSAGGLLLRCHHPQTLADEHWSAYLMADQFDLLLTGIVRRRDQYKNYTEVAIQLQLDSATLHQLQAFIYERLRLEHPDMHLPV